MTALGFFIAAIGLIGLSEAGLVKGKNGNGKGIQLEGWEWWYWLVLWRAVFAVGGGAMYVTQFNCFLRQTTDGSSLTIIDLL